ncbi:hypothetical protein ACFYO0_05705 [Streptomyces sp. NPDC006365]|uniref:hypothetical protein n=1 Tax=Streptomyces sp. NPDC006365 TaxID=3364744 RepID=UPI0036C0B478
MSPLYGYERNPHSTGHVITTVQKLMRTDGLNVSLTAMARSCGTSRNFLYANWKSASALHLRALTAELFEAFSEAACTRPSDGTVPGIIDHLTHVVRTVRRHPTTAAVARSSPTALTAAHTATDGPLVHLVTRRLSDVLHPLVPHGGIWADRALNSRAWKILWIARPAALCPQAVGDEDWEATLDSAFADLLGDLLSPWPSTE